MKTKRIYLFLLPVILLVIFANAVSVCAMNTGFQTSQLSEKEKSTLISNIQIKPLEKEPVELTIYYFDVNSNGLIAIANNSDDEKIICVYSNEWVFQYGYTIDSSGSIAVEWDGDRLNIYFVRGDVIVSVNPDGEILDLLRVSDTIENNSYRNHLLTDTERTIGDTTYSIENDMGILNFIAVSYSQVIARDAAGGERIIYDVSSKQLFNTTAVLIIVCIVVAIAVTTIVKGLIKVQRGK